MPSYEEREDEARREDSLYDRIGSLERINRQQEEKITEFKERIKELEIVLEIIRDKCDPCCDYPDNVFPCKQASQLAEQALKGIEMTIDYSNGETLKGALTRLEQDEKIAELEKEIESLKVINEIAKKQLNEIRNILIKLQTSTDNTFEHVLDKLKLVKSYFC